MVPWISPAPDYRSGQVTGGRYQDQARSTYGRMHGVQQPVSSLRTQGPITTGGCFAKGVCHSALTRDHAVWVPAFAGTTIEMALISSTWRRVPGSAFPALRSAG